MISRSPVSFVGCLRHLVGRHRERRDKPGSHGRRRVDGSGLDVLRVVVTAVDDDQILDAADDVELTVEVDAQIAGPEPIGAHRRAVGVAAHAEPRLQLVAEHQLGFLAACPIGAADVVAVQPDLTDLAIGQFGRDIGVDDHPPLAAGYPTAADIRYGVGSICRDAHRAASAQLLRSRWTTFASVFGSVLETNRVASAIP